MRSPSGALCVFYQMLSLVFSHMFPSALKTQRVRKGVSYPQTSRMGLPHTRGKSGMYSADASSSNVIALPCAFPQNASVHGEVEAQDRTSC